MSLFRGDWLSRSHYNSNTDKGEQRLQATSELDIRAYFDPVTFASNYPFYENISTVVTMFLQFKGEYQAPVETNSKTF